MEMSAILEGSVYDPVPMDGDQVRMFPAGKQHPKQMTTSEQYGFVDLDSLCSTYNSD